MLDIDVDCVFPTHYPQFASHVHWVGRWRWTKKLPRQTDVALLHL